MPIWWWPADKPTNITGSLLRKYGKTQMHIFTFLSILSIIFLIFNFFWEKPCLLKTNKGALTAWMFIVKHSFFVHIRSADLTYTRRMANVAKCVYKKNVAKFNSDNFDNYRKIIYSDLLSSLFLIITKVIKKFKRSNNI